MKRVLRFLVVLVLLTAVSGTAWWYFVEQGGTVEALKTQAIALIGKVTGRAPGGPPGAPGGPGGPGLPPGGMPVEAVPVKVGPVARTVTAVGTLLSSESVVIRPEVAGRVAEIAFQEGSRATRGQVLVRLDDAVPRATLAQTVASLNLSRAEFLRADELFRQGVGSARVRDQAQAKLAVDDAAVQLSRAQMDKLVLTAPFDGMLGLRKVSVGDVVQVGKDIVNLEAIDTLKLDFRIPEAFVQAVGVGQALALSVDAFPDRSFTGTVYAIDPLIDINGRSISIRARLDNPEHQLRPGLFARVVLTLAARTDAILIPEQALVTFGSEQFVFRIVDGKAARTRVRTGDRRNAEVEITHGLTPADVIVTAGQLKVRDGMPVQNVAAKLAGS